MIKQVVVERMSICPVCNRSVAVEDLRIGNHDAEGAAVLYDCVDCRQQQIFVAVIGELDTSNEDLDTMLDQRVTEWGFASAPCEQPSRLAPISNEDVIDIHSFLEGFGGDFKSEFGNL